MDPNPEMQKLFELARPRDVFLNVGVGEVGGGRLSQLEYEIRNDDIERNVHRSSMTYFMFDEATANTFSEEQAGKNQEVGRKLLGTKKIEILSLKEILDSNLKKGERIDLLSVDVEGMDLEVLESSDWKKYRPKVVICEDLGFDLDSFCAGRDDTKLRRQSLKVVEGKGVVGYLQGLGYKLKAMTPYSMIFRDEK